MAATLSIAQRLRQADEITSSSKPGIDATKKLPGENFKRPWPPLIKMEEAVKAKIDRWRST